MKKKVISMFSFNSIKNLNQVFKMIKSYDLLTSRFYKFQIPPDFFGEKNKTCLIG